MRIVSSLIHWVACSSAVVVVALLATGCDPCAGTASCGSTSGPRLVLDGQVVRAVDGRGVDGISIDFKRLEPNADPNPIHVTTSDGGFFHIDAPASNANGTVLDVTVNTPALKHPYVIRQLHAAPITSNGNAIILDRWVVDPYFPTYFDFFLATTGAPLLSTTIAFHRTSGPTLTGDYVDSSNPDIVHTLTDPVVGRAQFFQYGAFVTDTGDVVGDIFVNVSPTQTGVIRGVRLTPTYLYRAQPIVVPFNVTP
ncbi:MAG TPA: hypothetical protein VGM50_01530 [Gemmatimonadaceae bacterium]